MPQKHQKAPILISIFIFAVIMTVLALTKPRMVMRVTVKNNKKIDWVKLSSLSLSFSILAGVVTYIVFSANFRNSPSMNE